MTFHEWKQRSRAYRKAVNAARDGAEAKKIESLCRAAFTAGVDWGLDTHDAKVGAGRTATLPPNAEITGSPKASPG